MPSLFELALAYTKAGISIIPISADGTVGPDGHTPFDCGEYISRRIATQEELREWFMGDSRFGLAAVHGPISGGLECLDLIYAAAVKLFRQLVTSQGGEGLMEKLPAVGDTIQGRTRFFYRCSNPISGDKRLAQFELPGEPGAALLQLLVWAHGEGSWTVVPGSVAACLGSHGIYKWVSRDLAQVPTITEDERHLLWESASCLNGWVNPHHVIAPPSPDGFENSVSWERALLPLGWVKIREFGEVALWRSPGRTKPGYCAVSGIGLNRDLLYLLRTEEAYTKFGAFASFYFDGDVEKAKSVRLQPAPVSRWETAVGTRYLSAVQKTSPPLVSCITPTTGARRRFLPLAIKCFQRQTYPNSELVIVCDGEEDLSDLIPPGDERVRYFYLGRERHTIGTKRNFACERAKGDLIAHFDDDDWSHADRVSFQVGALLAEEAEVCGLSQLLFLEIGTGWVWLSRTPALLHPSLYPGLSFGTAYLYGRSYWSSSPFPDVPHDSDVAFTSAKRRQDRSVLLSDYRLCVAMIHGSNTGQYSKGEKSTYWSPWSGDLRGIMGTDLDYYISLQKS